MNPPSKTTCSSKQRCRSRRRGVAATEFAVCLPILMLMIFALIESCSMIFLKQSLTVTSYEGVRTALEEGANGNDVRLTCQSVLDDRRVLGSTITIQPPDFENLAAGQYIQVTVSASADQNSIIPGSFFRGRTLTASATMMKEF